MSPSRHREIKTTPFHPRSDGQAERLNRTLLQMLRTTATDHFNNWPSYLPTVLSAHRMTVHSVTGITPNMAMLGREVLTPVTLIAQPPNEPVKLTVPYVTSFRNAMREAQQESTHSVARTQNMYYKHLFKQEAQLMLTTGSTRLAVSRGQQTRYHSTCYI